LGLVDVPSLVKRYPRLALVQELATRYRFLHWELEFADIFAERGGFDLVLGNPPWLKVEWTEAEVLGDVDPIFVIRSLPAAEASTRRQGTLTHKATARQSYLSSYEAAGGVQSFLAAKANYPDLQGQQPHLAKCFLPQAWLALRPHGVSGFLHDEGLFQDT